MALKFLNNGTFSGSVSAEDNIYLTDAGTVRGKLLLNASDRDNVELRAESLGSTMKFFTVGTEALLLDASQNATFTGSVTINLGSEGTYFTGGSGGIRQLSITSGTNTSAHALHTFNIASSNGKYEFDINGTTEFSLNNSNADFLRTVTAPNLNLTNLTNNAGSTSVLVLNQILGNELITNGDFDTSLDWSVGSQWSIANGKATYVGSGTSALYQNETLANATEYRILFTVSGATGNGARIWIGNSGGTTNYLGGTYKYYSNGTHEEVFTMPSAQTTLSIYSTTGGSGYDLDTVSLKQVLGTGTSVQKREISSNAFAEELWEQNDDGINNIGGVNVGIGTASPTQKLEVNGVIESPYLEYKPFVFYDFNSDTVSQWGKNNATLSTPSKSVTRFTTTGGDANLNRLFNGSGFNSPAIPGGQNQIIRIRYKWISGTAGSGEIFYATSGHGYSGSYYKSYALNTDGEYHTLVLDMSNLNSGGTDWIDNDIIAIRFDLINITPVVIDIDWIAVGGNGWGTQYFENDVAFMNGNVGIGNTNPSSALSISKSMGAAFIADFINPAVNGHGLLIQAGGTTGTRYITQWKDALGTERFHMEDDGEAYFQGNVGIGTTSSKAKLEVAASVNGNPVTSGSTQTNGALRVRGSATNVLDIGQQSASPYAMWMQVCESTSLGVSYPLVINPNGGNVGIGTDSPNAKLHVIDTSNPGATSGSVIIEGRRDGSPNVLTLRAKDSSAPAGALPNGQGPIVRFQGFDGTDFENMGYIQVAADGQAVANGDAPSFMAFGTSANGSSSPTEKMRITSSAEGHVELSGTAPVIKATASNGGSGLRINIAGQTSGQLFRVQEDGTTKFQIDENGNVGINDTSPDFKLDVEGTFGVSDLPFNSSSVSVLVADETLGPELSVLPSAVSGVGDFYAFVKYGNNTIAYTAGTTETVITYVDDSRGAYQYLNTAYNLSSNLVIGSNYKVAITFKVNTGTFTWQVHNGATTTSLPASSNTSFETIEYINTPTQATNSFIRAFNMGTGQIVTVSKVSVKQVTSASNQIQKSELNNIPRTNPAASLYDLIPNGAFTTTYAFTSTAGTYAEVMSGDDVITETGTYSVQMIVNDFAVGGTQYDEKYSGVMSWHETSTNDSGIGAISEIALHRAGHAGNQGITYLRTRETTSAANPGPNELKLEIMCNRTYSGASNIIFKFVRLI